MNFDLNGIDGRPLDAAELDGKAVLEESSCRRGRNHDVDHAARLTAAIKPKAKAALTDNGIATRRRGRPQRTDPAAIFDLFVRNGFEARRWKTLRLPRTPPQAVSVLPSKNDIVWGDFDRVYQR